MKPPREHSIHQIAVTSVCWPHTGIGTDKRGPLSACSNCTRLLAHEKKRYVMKPDVFEQVINVAKDFLYTSPKIGRPLKCLGLFGGEPLMSPHFGEYVEIFCHLVPDARHRGLWTSFDWRTHEGAYGKAKPLVDKLFGGLEPSWNTGPCLNWNMHEEDQKCEHHPNLHAIQDFVPDEKRRMMLINGCWLNQQWSAAYALDHNEEPKFYFCELASSFDRVMDLGLGLDLVPGVWDHDLPMVQDADGILRPQGAYAAQVMGACNRCGQALPHKHGRRDREWVDDVSQSNLEKLIQIGSPMIERGDYVLANPENYDEAAERHGYTPWHYIIKPAKERRSPVEPKRAGK